jgi:hypothetical protein
MALDAESKQGVEDPFAQQLLPGLEALLQAVAGDLLNRLQGTGEAFRDEWQERLKIFAGIVDVVEPEAGPAQKASSLMLVLQYLFSGKEMSVEEGEALLAKFSKAYSELEQEKNRLQEELEKTRKQIALLEEQEPSSSSDVNSEGGADLGNKGPSVPSESGQVQALSEEIEVLTQALGQKERELNDLRSEIKSLRQAFIDGSGPIADILEIRDRLLGSVNALRVNLDEALEGVKDRSPGKMLGVYTTFEMIEQVFDRCMETNRQLKPNILKGIDRYHTCLKKYAELLQRKAKSEGVPSPDLFLSAAELSGELKCLLALQTQLISEQVGDSASEENVDQEQQIKKEWIYKAVDGNTYLFDFYSILGLKVESIDDNVIGAAYRIVARKYHPDGRPKQLEDLLTELSKIISLAKKNLTDPESKESYLKVLQTNKKSAIAFAEIMEDLGFDNNAYEEYLAQNQT